MKNTDVPLIGCLKIGFDRLTTMFDMFYMFGILQ